MNRRAPEGGYEFSNKHRYRKNVWSVFRDKLKGADSPDVALLPSKEGTEIEVALQAGFAEHRLHVIDHNPAIVATLKKRFPRINTYGVSAGRAFERMAEQGIRLHAANLDFCGNMSDKYQEEVGRILSSGVLSEGALVGFTMLRGRETGEVREYVSRAEEALEDDPALAEEAKRVLDKAVTSRKPTVRDATRLGFLSKTALLQDHMAAGLRSGVYLSGNQTMLWTVAFVISQEEARDVVEGYADWMHSLSPQVVKRIADKGHPNQWFHNRAALAFAAYENLNPAGAAVWMNSLIRGAA